MARSPDKLANKIKISYITGRFLIQKNKGTRYAGGRIYSAQQMHDYLYDYLRHFQIKPKLEIEKEARAKLIEVENARLLNPNTGEKGTRISLKLRAFIEKGKPIRLEEILQEINTNTE